MCRCKIRLLCIPGRPGLGRNRALLGENYLLLLALLAYISSVKKNDVTQPSPT